MAEELDNEAAADNSDIGTSDIEAVLGEIEGELPADDSGGEASADASSKKAMADGSDMLDNLDAEKELWLCTWEDLVERR